jgi:hypothetical protein
MELMRHESIETTMKFYVGRSAQRTADILWQAHEQALSNSSGNTPSAGLHYSAAQSAGIPGNS